jgi:hypothetical protein
MKKIYRITVLALLAVIVVSGVLFFRSGLLGNQERFTSQGVIEQVKAVSELNTVEMYFSEIIDFKDALTIREIKIPLTEKSFIFTVKARVKAGTDLSGLTEEDVILEENKLTLRLADPVITSKEILSYKAYSEKDGLFNEVTNEDTLKALELFTEDLENQALENGILDKARENAEKAIEDLFAALGFETVVIQWK